MTSKLKCPVCNHKLYQTASEPATYCCLYKDCQSDFKFAGSKELWQALIQAKQDLETARKALEDMQHWLGVIRCSMVSHLNNQNNTLLEHYETDPTVQNIDKAKKILKHYIEQIDHIADVSKKAEHKE